MYKKRLFIVSSLLLLLISCNQVDDISISVNNSDSNSNINDPFNPYKYLNEMNDPPVTGTMLHYTNPINHPDYEFPFIGDVHPYFDEKQQKWFMFYLDTSGAFHSKLLNSYDGLHWTVNEDFWIGSGFANYAVLNVFEKDNIYYSYYADYQVSKSINLIDWEYAGGKYQIPQDLSQFPGGIRDPSVVYDETTDRYYSIGLSYPKRIPSENIYLSNLAINMSIGNDQTKWLTTHKKVLKDDQLNKDYECPQLIKIGNRWYVIASQYGNSIHGVGRTSYFIGDENKNPYEVDWQSKDEYFLTTEDLCAAQIAKKNDKYYIFGWIPRYFNKGFWGGYINLPTEVYALSDGTLATRLSQEIEGKIRGGSYYELTEGQKVSKINTITANLKNRFDIQAQFTLNSGVMELRTQNNKFRVVITNTIDTKIEVFVGTYKCFTMDLRFDALDGVNDLRIIGEGKNLELFLNNTYAMTSRVDTSFEDNDKLIISALENEAYVSKLLASRLKYLEEI